MQLPKCILVHFSSPCYLEGQGDLVRKLITPVIRIVTPVISLISLLARSPDSASNNQKGKDPKLKPRLLRDRRLVWSWSHCKWRQIRTALLGFKRRLSKNGGQPFGVHSKIWHPKFQGIQKCTAVWRTPAPRIHVVGLDCSLSESNRKMGTCFNGIAFAGGSSKQIPP